MDLDPIQCQDAAVSENDTNNIILSYLSHNCYKETLESFIACNGMKQSADFVEDMDGRKRILNYALDGNALRAIELTEQLIPGLLENNNDLYFGLLCLHFVELVRIRKCTEALEFAQMKLTSFSKVQQYVEKLEDLIALLAYEDPEKSPMFRLLSPEYKQQVADSLNKAILDYYNLPTCSSLEKVLQQTAVVTQQLNEVYGKDGAPQFSLKDFLES